MFYIIVRFRACYIGIDSTYMYMYVCMSGFIHVEICGGLAMESHGR